MCKGLRITNNVVLPSYVELKSEMRKYMGVTLIQNRVDCYTCKAALDEHGRNFRHGMLVPLLLLMGNFKKCMNYEFDTEKVELQLLRKENERTEHTGE